MVVCIGMQRTVLKLSQADLCPRIVAGAFACCGGCVNYNHAAARLCAMHAKRRYWCFSRGQHCHGAALSHR